MIFSRANAGKWVASKEGKVVASSKKLAALMKLVDKRSDKSSLWFDKVPPVNFVGGSYGI